MLPVVTSASPRPEDVALLDATDHADCFAIDLGDAELDAPTAARRIFTSMPDWVDALMRLRNRLVAMVGLKPAGAQTAMPPDTLGGFPVVSSSPERIVLGFDDRHLDFRIVLHKTALDGAGVRVDLTTVVSTHNLAGRLYLAAVLPFHRLIVPTGLRGLADR